MFKNFQRSFSDVISLDLTDLLDCDLIGELIGPQGANITSIEKKHNVIVELKNEEMKLTISVTGLYWDVKSAYVEVFQLLNEIRNNATSHCVRIPSRMIGFLIGRHGSKINHIRGETGVSIEINRPLDKNSNQSSFATLVIIGNNRSILAALHLIKDRLDSFEVPPEYEIRSHLVENLKQATGDDEDF
ncbi:unnamed protein product [Caenorhabditis auriculariae]|uniref:K Homology domain-containing protein n=1 Tax=Caenorhabditis auriculariae TaxID=2777116 RepID=A0A8S1GMR9_9PELO|nr:unnamed protein product [Caenorhabditis auriculariae]